MVKVLTDEKRRQLILDALSPGANIKKLARDRGLSRSTLYEHINRAVVDPERKWREAEAEAAFRRQIYELTR